VSTKAQAPERFDFVDAARGLAVVFMLWMHTGDGWLRPDLREGTGWVLVRAVGGLAAPSFLLLVGVSLGLAWRRPMAERPLRVDLARGLQVLALAHLLRMQMWMIDGAGYEHPPSWLGALPMLGGWLAVLAGLSRWARGERCLGLLGTGGATVAGSLLYVHLWIPHRLQGLLRVDVLQAIGAGILIVSLLGRAGRPVNRAGARTGALLLLGVLAAALTHWMRSWVPGPLPAPLAGYLAYWEPAAGRPPVGMFPLFPWLAYPCFGVLVGIRWGRLGPRRALESAISLCALGATLALASCELLPPVHALLTELPELLQPVRVAYRVGVVMCLLGLSVGLARPGVPGRQALLGLGRASLVVYWIHLEFAFGMLSRPLSRGLTLTGWALCLFALTAAMVVLARGWLELRGRRIFKGSGPRRALATDP
jgi:uncharacterized membrane protein